MRTGLMEDVRYGCGFRSAASSLYAVAAWSRPVSDCQDRCEVSLLENGISTGHWDAMLRLYLPYGG